MTPAATATRLLLGLALAAAPGCIPSTAQYLSIPIRDPGAREHEHARVRVPLTELARRLDDFAPQQLGFYFRGRVPIPHRLVDTDADGAVDAAEVEIPVRRDGRTRLVVVHPRQTDEAAATELPEAPPETEWVDFEVDVRHAMR